MVFAHGFGCDQTMWRHVAPAFEADHTTVTFDYLGMGRADARAYDPRPYSTLGGYAEAVLEICEALDLRDVALVGHSVSATIAARRPRGPPRARCTKASRRTSPRSGSASNRCGGRPSAAARAGISRRSNG
jgi:sigma-B regulation protein RsbQ